MMVGIVPSRYENDNYSPVIPTAGSTTATLEINPLNIAQENAVSCSFLFQFQPGQPYQEYFARTVLGPVAAGFSASMTIPEGAISAGFKIVCSRDAFLGAVLTLA